MFETVVVIWGIGFLGFTVFSITSKPRNKNKCFDLTRRVIKGKKHTEALNKRIKSTYK